MDKEIFKKAGINTSVLLLMSFVGGIIAFAIYDLLFVNPATATGNMVINSSTFISNRQCMYSVCDQQESKMKNIFQFSTVCGLYAPGDKIIMTKIMPDPEPIVRKGKKK